jgi:hypothetical protein
MKASYSGNTEDTTQAGKRVVKFIVHDWREGGWIKSTLAWGCRSQLYPPVRDYEFGYRDAESSRYTRGNSENLLYKKETLIKYIVFCPVELVSFIALGQRWAVHK